MQARHLRSGVLLKLAVWVSVFVGITAAAFAESTHRISIDGDFSFSLEASGELAPGHQWASDTGSPIIGYYLSPFADPQLQIARPGPDGKVILSWASGAVGLRLQRTSSLTNPDWQYVSGSETTNQVLLPAGTGHLFFRLVEP